MGSNGLSYVIKIIRVFQQKASNLGRVEEFNAENKTVERYEMLADVPEHRGGYYFAGGYSNRDYISLVKAFKDLHYKLIIGASSKKYDLIEYIKENEISKNSSKAVIMPMKDDGKTGFLFENYDEIAGIIKRIEVGASMDNDYCRKICENAFNRYVKKFSSKALREKLLLSVSKLQFTSSV